MEESKLPADLKKRISNLVNFVYSMGAEYMLTEDVRAIRKVTSDAGREGIFGSKHCIYSALSFGVDVVLPSHWDEDFFYSIVFVLIDEAMSSSDLVLKHFVFPEYGLSVPLRNGDLLIFNPLEFHSISCTTPGFVGREFYSCSIYLKTKTISGNSNHQSWSEGRQKYLEVARGLDVVNVAPPTVQRSL